MKILDTLNGLRKKSDGTATLARLPNGQGRVPSVSAAKPAQACPSLPRRQAGGRLARVPVPLKPAPLGLFPQALKSCVLGCAALAFLAAPAAAFAQTDEIQVYDASIADQGKFNLMLHNNYTPRGLTTPAFPGGIVPDQSYNGAAEWAYGVRPWFEQGLYLPLYSFSKVRGGSINGFKLRELFVRPHAGEHTFFYGVNFEFSVNALYWERRRITSEVRPILGWHLHPVDIIVNPIMDTDYTGGIKSLDFAPAERLAYNFSPKWAMAAEEYADYGPLRSIYSARDQFRKLYAVVDLSSKIVNVEFGVGFGLTAGTDKTTIKLMLSRDLN